MEIGDTKLDILVVNFLGNFSDKALLPSLWSIFSSVVKIGWIDGVNWTGFMTCVVYKLIVASVLIAGNCLLLIAAIPIT